MKMKLREIQSFLLNQSSLKGTLRLKNRNMKNTILILLAVLVLSITGHTQNVFPPSANAAAMVRQINTPVNLYTGVPSINVPLYVLPNRKGSLPISISYHASGIKVDDTPSDAGMGWSLNAGGSITRVVRDIPDDDPNGFMNSGGNTGAVINSTDFINKFNNTDGSTYWTNYQNFTNNNDWDTEPDVFYFSYPGGSGKFYLDHNGNPLTVPYQDIKIEKTLDAQNKLEQWVVTDKSGTKYYFGETAQSREFTTTEVSERGYDPFPQGQPVDFHRFDPTNSLTQAGFGGFDWSGHYISSWYLNRIVDYNGLELFNLAYTTRPTIWFNNSSETIENEVTALGATQTSTTVKEIFVRNHYTPTVLQTISSSLGTVIFSYTIEGRLSNVKIYSKPTTSLVAHYDFTYTTTGDELLAQDYRHFLQKIIQKPVDGGDGIIYRKFEYNSLQLPYMGSPKVDHWGYFNDYIGPNTRIASYEINGQEYGNTDADKTPRIPFAKAGILEKMNLQTGGHIAYDYELNETFQGQRGGLRIKTVTSHDGSSTANDIVTSYTYDDASGVSSGRGRDLPVYNSSDDLDKLVIVSGQSVNALYDQGGVAVGYETVTETIGAGKTVYQYQGFQANPDLVLTHKVVKSATNIAQSSTMSNLLETTPKSSKSWQRGLLKSRSVYNGDGDLLSHSTNNYTTIDVGNSKLYGLVTNKAENGGDTYYDMVMYEISSVGYVLDNTESIGFDQDSPGVSITSATEYTYDSNNLNLKEVEATDSEGDIMISKTSYLNEYVIGSTTDPEALAMKELQNRDVDIPIEQVQYIKKGGSGPELVLGASVTVFKEFNSGGSLVIDQIFPEKAYVLETTTPLSSFTPSRILSNAFDTDGNYPIEPNSVFNDYDDYGNVLSVMGRDRVITEYTWDVLNNSLPATITTNPGIAGISKTTSYEYKYLVGVEKQTDPNGRVIVYQYDTFNRLSLVLDHEGPITNPAKILRKMEYKVAVVE